MHPGNPWIRVSLIFFLALLVRIALGGESVPDLLAPRGRNDGRIEEYLPEGRQPFPVLVCVGPGLVLYNHLVGGTMNVGVIVRVGRREPVYAGLDLGLGFWSRTVDGQQELQTGTGVQVLPTLLYRMELAGYPRTHPILGLSVGPYLMPGQLHLDGIGSFTASPVKANVYIEALLRGGVEYQLAPGFYFGFEGKLGLLESQFVLLPQTQATFLL